MPALFLIWKIINYSGEKRLLLLFSFFMVKISHLNEVSFKDWINAYILLSKALFINHLIDDSINVLINLLDIFACIPLEDFKFLSEIYRQNNISLTNMFLNFDNSLKYFSKYHVYEKSKGVFLLLERMLRNSNINKRIFLNDNNNQNSNIDGFDKSDKTHKTPETEIYSSDCNSQDFYLDDKKRNKSSNNSNFKRDITIINNREREKSNDNKKNNKNNKYNIRINKFQNIIKDEKIIKERLIIKKSNIENEEEIKLKLSPNTNFKTNPNSNSNSNSLSKKSDLIKSLNMENLKSEYLQLGIFDEKKPKNIKKSTENKNNNNNCCFNIEDFSKLENYIKENIKKIEIPIDSPCII
jgi:hypothetical protein